VEIILASASPRRRELLGQLGLSFTVDPAHVDERVAEPLAPAALVEHLAAIKAAAVAERYPDHLVIGADTIVVIDGEVLGKPVDRAHAMAMLRRLQGREHQVFTGIALRQGERSIVAHEETVVRFRPLSDGEIERYVDSGDPMDKAGAYGIQGRAGAMIEGIRGDYFNVVGLPLCRLVQLLSSFGVTVL
jgi:septum formation protein